MICIKYKKITFASSSIVVILRAFHDIILICVSPLPCRVTQKQNSAHGNCNWFKVEEITCCDFCRFPSDLYEELRLWLHERNKALDVTLLKSVLILTPKEIIMIRSPWNNDKFCGPIWHIRSPQWEINDLGFIIRTPNITFDIAVTQRSINVTT